jgi:hypothetical protein
MERKRCADAAFTNYDFSGLLPTAPRHGNGAVAG